MSSKLKINIKAKLTAVYSSFLTCKYMYLRNLGNYCKELIRSSYTCPQIKTKEWGKMSA